MSIEHDGTGLSRRGFLRAGAGATVAGAAVAGTASGPVAAQSEDPFDGYLSDASNFDGTVVDERGSAEVTITVGASGNNGNFAFAPPAVRVDPGTTVVWEWNGEGGQHNVVHEGGDFESELVADAGHTFTQSFQDAGVVKYFCQPHKGLGMKGVVVVGDVQVAGTDGGEGAGGGSGGEDADGSGGEGGGGSASEGGGGSHGGSGDGDTAEPSAGNEMAANTLLAMLGLGFLSPVIFALILRWQRPSGPTE